MYGVSCKAYFCFVLFVWFFIFCSLHTYCTEVMLPNGFFCWFFGGLFWRCFLFVCFLVLGFGFFALCFENHMPQIRHWVNLIILQVEDSWVGLTPHSQPQQEASYSFLPVPISFPLSHARPCHSLVLAGTPIKHSAEQIQGRLVICWPIKLSHLSVGLNGHQIKKRRKRNRDPTPQQGQVVRLPIETGDIKTPIQPSYGYSSNSI